MIFSFIPPEINSTLMYSGPGSGPLAAAAAGWQSLASDLQSTATSFQTIVSELTSGSWTGPSSQAMLASVQPYVGWLTDTSAQAAQTGAQAAASVNAYEAAYAATIPPALVFENRAELMLLVATNFFGQNTPAIAANEATYAGYWATDATAMNTYLAAATQTTALPQMAAPMTATNGTAQAAAAATPVGGITNIGSAFNTLLSGLGNLFTSTGFSSTGLSAVSTDFTTLMGDLGLSSLLAGGAAPALSYADIVPLQAAYYLLMMGSMPARMFMSMGSGAAGGRGAAGGIMAGSEGLMQSIGQFVDGKMQAVVGSVSGQLKNWGSAISAQLGRASTMGGLSVPHGWSEAATGAVTRAAPVLPSTSVAAPTVAPPAAGMPGGPWGNALMGALSGRGLASMASKAPKVVPKSPAAG